MDKSENNFNHILSVEYFIFVDFFAVKVDGSDVNPEICLITPGVLIYKRIMDLIISVYFHQIVPIRFRLEGYEYFQYVYNCVFSL